MLVLFETAVGYAIFKVNDEKKLAKVDLYEEFKSPQKANNLICLQHFSKFNDTTEAMTAATALIEGKVSKKLKSILKKVVLKDHADDTLAVADAKLGTAIKEKFNISCICTSAVQDLMSCIRSQIECLVPEWNDDDEKAMQLGLSHGMGRYKLKFSPDKVDTMIIQAVSLLDDLDKELNNYIMRCKEWYGWHFPELVKLISDNSTLIRTILALGMKTNAATADLSDVLSEEVEAKVKELAEVSMGTEIADEDMLNINHLCRNVLDLQEYRTQLYEYLKNRMMAIAPNLTVLVGELVGARLVSHAGSLINLAKHPASTVQILGAEKALFRALKTKHDTPKYGLIYHAQLVGQSNPKIKGKMSRMLAAKTSLACRVDALGEEGTTNELGIEHRAKLETRLKFLEEGGMRRISGTGKSKGKFDKYEHKSKVHPYKPGADSTLPTNRKRRFEEEEVAPEFTEGPDIFSQGADEETKEAAEPLGSGEGEGEEVPKKKKKKNKKNKKQVDETEEVETPVAATSPKKKVKKEKAETVTEESAIEPAETVSPKKKVKKEKGSQLAAAEAEETPDDVGTAKRKKAKQKATPETEVVATPTEKKKKKKKSSDE